jgi:hypothetical protein
MITTKRLVAVAATAANALGAGAAPSALASSHWSKTQCKSYVKAFDKKHDPSSKQKSEANKALKDKGCSQRVA